MEKQLIINADDFGHTAGISAGILQAHLNGIVTSTSVMMNRPYAAEGLRSAQKECPRLGIGVHLVLTTGRPLLPAERIPSLVNGEGKFYRQAELIARLESIDPEEALDEWRAQVELFRTVAGCAPDHLDSHHHSSYFTPALFERMLALAGELGCPIRLPWTTPASFADYLSAEAAVDYASQISKLLERFNPPRPDAFIGHFYDEGATLENLKSIAQSIAEDPDHGTFELMCHPAVVDDELRRASTYNEQRGRELTLMQNNEVKTLLLQQGIRLIGF